MLRATAPDFSFFLFAIYASHPSKISVLDKIVKYTAVKSQKLAFPSMSKRKTTTSKHYQNR